MLVNASSKTDKIQNVPRVEITHTNPQTDKSYYCDECPFMSSFKQVIVRHKHNKHNKSHSWLNYGKVISFPIDLSKPIEITNPELLMRTYGGGKTIRNLPLEQRYLTLFGENLENSELDKITI